MIRTVGRFLSRVKYLPTYVFLHRRRSFTSRKLYSCLEKILTSFNFLTSLDPRYVITLDF